MKLQLRLKHLFYLWAGLALLMGILIVIAHVKFKPERVLAMVELELNKNFHGRNIRVNKIDYSYILDFRLKFHDLQVYKGKILEGKIKEAEVHVPWWLILFQKGQFQVNLKNVQVFKQTAINNESVNNPSSNGTILAPTKVNFNIPSFFKKTRLNIKIENFRLVEKEKTRFRVSKLFIKNFTFNNLSAFELNIPIKVALKNFKSKASLWIFGDLKWKDDSLFIKFRGDIGFASNLDWDSVQIDGSSEWLSQNRILTTNFNLFIAQEQVGGVNLVFNENEAVADLKIKKLPSHYFQTLWPEYFGGEYSFKPDFKNPLEGSGKAVIQSGILKSYQLDLATQTITGWGKKKIPGKLEFIIGPDKNKIIFSSIKGDLEYIWEHAQTHSHINESYKLGNEQYIEDFLNYFAELQKSKTAEITQTVYVNDSQQKAMGEIKGEINTAQQKLMLDLKKTKNGLKAQKYWAGDHVKFSINSQKYNLIHLTSLMSPFFTKTDAKLSGILFADYNESTPYQGEWKVQFELTDMNYFDGPMLEYFFQFWSQKLDLPITFPTLLKGHLNSKAGRLKVENFIFWGEKSRWSVNGTLSSGTKSTFFVKDDWNKKTHKKVIYWD